MIIIAGTIVVNRDDHQGYCYIISGMQVYSLPVKLSLLRPLRSSKGQCLQFFVLRIFQSFLLGTTCVGFVDFGIMVLTRKSFKFFGL